MSRVLLVAPTYMNLYEDIVIGLQKKGYEVQYYPDKRIKGDPFNKVSGGEKKMSIDDFLSLLEAMWSEILAKDPFHCLYDYFFVVDGLSVPPALFNHLRKINPNIVTCNYLYDRVKGVYELNRNFPYYDRVFSFDQKDCEDFNLSFLPIYWTPIERKQQDGYDVFGFGAYDELRLKTFNRIRRIASNNNLSSYIKIYSNYSNLFSFVLRNTAKAVIGRDCLPIPDILSGLFTNKSLSPSIFKQMIASSDTIVDTNHPFQDGLTARFMWALGAEKKIITTNASVRDYAFFSKEQFFVLEDNWQQLPEFLYSEFKMSGSIRSQVAQYRIDRWLDTVLLNNISF